MCRHGIRLKMQQSLFFFCLNYANTELQLSSLFQQRLTHYLNRKLETSFLAKYQQLEMPILQLDGE